MAQLQIPKKDNTAHDILDAFECRVAELEANSSSSPFIGLDTKSETARELHARTSGILRRLALLTNLNAPVNAIPEEILALIFRESSDPGWDFKLAVLTRLAGVCKRWRTVAISNASLWAALIIKGGKFRNRRNYGQIQPESNIWLQTFAEYISRSKGAPLFFSMDTDATPADFSVMTQIIELLRTHAPRMHKFHLKAHEYSTFIKSVPRLNLPCVESLEIRGTIESDPITQEVVSCVVQPPFPQLRHLLLERYKAPLPKIFSGLTSLHLDYAFENEGISDLLSVLDQNPLLEDIRITKLVLLDSTTHQSFQGRTSKLPHLSSLKLCECAAGLILEHLQIPSTADIRIAEFDFDNGIELFRQRLPGDLNRLGLNLRESVDISVQEHSGNGYRALELSLIGGCDDDGGITIEQWCPPRYDQRHMPFFATLIHCLVTGTKEFFDSVKTLSIRFRYPVKYPADNSHEQESHHWRKVFQRFPKLTELTVRESVSQYLLIPLASFEDESVILPHLRSLHLRLYAPAERQDRIEILLREIIEFIRFRKNAGCPLDDFSLRLWHGKNDEACDLPHGGIKDQLLGLEGNGVEQLTFAQYQHPVEFASDSESD